MEYNPSDIEAKWQELWQKKQLYKVEIDRNKPKYYVLDMFPYPSGAGLHVGHPLGYIASDIIARYKRLLGYNVLHPMGFDSFGLPAEQYAIETGQHPAVTTEKNIDTFKKQLSKIGFCYDWDREVRTSDADYYKWTQWIFGELFNSWYNNKTNKAEHIDILIAEFEQNGNQNVSAACDEDTPLFTAADWKNWTKKQQSDILLKYRLAYLADAFVNWCPALGTVLANDEVKDGVSERGGHPVERKRMRQWMMRITAYAERLLTDLDTIDWSESIKEVQRNWIGKSLGAEVTFPISPTPNPSPQGGEQQNETLALFRTANLAKWEKLKELARNNRKNPTPAEAKLWDMLRGDALGVNFRRQHTIEDFIVDFVCLKRKLVIEVDGEIHLKEENQEYDTARSFVLNDLGYNILRFTNNEVLETPEKVLDKIKVVLAGNGTQYLNTHLQNPSLWGGAGVGLTVFTTRIDTIFGVTYLAIAPEHELVPQLTTPAQRQAVEEYVEKAKNRSERDRMSDVKTVSGVFTGSYVINPFNGEQVPVWIADYVLAGYGTGVVMAVPSSDDRDFRFAKHFNLPIICVIENTEELENPTEVKKGKMINSGFLNGLDTEEAIKKAIEFVVTKGIGKAKINYKMRDAVFSRQRYWGEPVPVFFDEQGTPNLLDNSQLPLLLPQIDQYKPTETGEPPLGRATTWKHEGKYEYELSTMPGWAGSSWYWLRYMDNKNNESFVSKEAENYWQDVDLYMGGAEHGTGHLLYSRFWNKVLFDRGYVSAPEPFKKLINQGMIQGRSNYIYKLKDEHKFVSFGLKEKYNDVVELHVDVNIVENDVLDLEAFKKWRPEYADAEFETEDGKYICGWSVEKMSKRWYNVVNPDDVVAKYSADTLRLYEMFLGPLELSKPWSTQGIDGTHKFLRKLWRLFYDDKGTWRVVNEAANKDELKILHKTIRKVREDLDRFAFNTPVSTFMICVNELTDLKCHKKEILSDLLVLLSPFAPHITEELWFALHHADKNLADWKAEYSIMNSTFPQFKEEYVTENSFEYPISINGKVRHKMTFGLDMPTSDIEAQVLAAEAVQKWLDGKPPKKVIIVQGKIVNVVI
jgi:leucyl-tRNA synthetase